MRLAISLLALGLVVGCGGGAIEPSDDDQTVVQTAFIDAADGDVVELAAGTFTFTDPLEMTDRTGVTIRGAGMDETVLDFSGQAAGGTGIDLTNMTDLVVEDLTIMDAAGNGLRISGSNNVVIRRVHAGWTNEDDVNNGKYAIYPVDSDNVLIDGAVATNSSDAGIYVGQVANCVVRNSTARGNVAGIEIENSTGCEVHDNIAEDNTGGILVFELPGLPRRGGGTLVHDNVMRNNNRLNFGDPNAIIGLAPSGTGMFLLAANDVEVRNNTFENNNGVAISVISYNVVSALTGAAPPDDMGFDPYNEGIWVHDNTFTGNGSSPGSMTAMGGNDSLATLLGLLAAAGTELTEMEDVSWDGFLREGLTPSDVLCMQNNGGATFRLFDVPGLLADMPMSNADATPHDCMGMAQPETDVAFAAFAAE